jgi:Lrp/AsnC family leucine-responsive transcriptional regulator
MDAKDLRILHELDKDSRQPLSAISGRVGISKQALKQRIRRMESDGVILGYYTVTDVFRLGRVGGRLWIKLRGTTVEKEREIIDYALRMKNVGWVVSLDGIYDLVVVFWARDLIELSNLKKELEFRFSSLFKETSLSFIIREHHISHRYFRDEDEINEHVSDKKYGGYVLTELDRKILEILSQDSRATLVGISEKLGVSAKAVGYRIKMLERKRVILCHRVNVDNSKLGYTWYKVFLSLQNMNSDKERELMSYLRENKSVVFMTEVLGQSDLEFEVLVKSNRELHSIVSDLRLRFADILKEYSSVILYNTHRIRYFPL